MGLRRVIKNIEWVLYGTEYVLRKKLENCNINLNKRMLYKKTYLSSEDASAYIKEKLVSNEPFMAARIGWNEMSMMKAFDFQKKDKYRNVMNNMCDAAGFFPNDYSLGKKFLDLMLDVIKDVDIMATMNSPYEEYYIRKNMKKDGMVTPFSVMEFWTLNDSWTKALKGKKVLVIHPFEKSIRNQYEKRSELFGEKQYLPDFELSIYKAIQTAGGEEDDRFASWFDALEYMINDIQKLDFDVAIVGCGAYGFPLSAYIRRMNKQVIHMGGVSQILFGIKGNRWMKPSSLIKPYMNESWVWALPEETPKNVNLMEGGPYFQNGNYFELDRGKQS